MVQTYYRQFKIESKSNSKANKEQGKIMVSLDYSALVTGVGR